MKVLIIVDEKKTATELKRMIESGRAGMEVTEVIATVKEGIERLTSGEAPDLIFSDIQLADGLSFEIFKEVTVSAPVIFCTAFEEYAIQAFESNGIDYLLKPIDEEKLEHALRKLEHTVIPSFREANEKENDYKRRMEELLRGMESETYKQSILTYRKERIIPLKTSEIAYVHSTNNVTTAHMKNGNHYVVDYTLDELEKALNPNLFMRANRQFIVNKESVKDLEYHLTRRLSVRLTVETEEEIMVSKLRAKAFLEWMES